MAIKLTSKNPDAVDVQLGDGASIRIRPATSHETTLARARVTELTAGLLDGQDAAETVATALGDEFRDADFTRPDWIASASERFALLQLTLLCADSWEGIQNEDGSPAELTEANVAMLLRDPEMARRISRVVNGRVLAEADEGKGLPVSSNGAPGTGDNDALPAAS